MCCFGGTRIPAGSALRDVSFPDPGTGSEIPVQKRVIPNRQLGVIVHILLQQEVDKFGIFLDVILFVIDDPDQGKDFFEIRVICSGVEHESHLVCFVILLLTATVGQKIQDCSRDPENGVTGERSQQKNGFPLRGLPGKTRRGMNGRFMRLWCQRRPPEWPLRSQWPGSPRFQRYRQRLSGECPEPAVRPG